MSAAVLPIMDASGDNYYHAHRSRGATAATRRMPTDDSPSVRFKYVDNRVVYV